MSFGEVVQSNHYSVAASTASVALQFSNPTVKGNSIIVLMTRGFGGGFGSTDIVAITHPNWTFTDRTGPDSGGDYSPLCRLIDCLNAPVGFGAATATRADGSDFVAGDAIDIYEIDTHADGCTFQSVSIDTYGEGESMVAPFNHTLAVEFDRRAFILYARQFSSNSASALFDNTHTYQPSWSAVLGLPLQYSTYPALPTTARVRQVFHQVLDHAVPTPMEQHTWAPAAGANTEAGAVIGQYVESTVALQTLTGAQLYGGAGSYVPRSNSRTGTWAAGGSTTLGLTKPTGTAAGDGVFLVHLFAGDPGTITWPSGFVELDTGGFNGYLGPKSDTGEAVQYEIGDLDKSGDAVLYGFYWAIAAKEAGASEPATYTTTRTDTSDAGRGFAFTMVAMPAATHVIAAETGGNARGPDGYGVTGGNKTNGSGECFHGLWVGGTSDEVHDRLFARQRAKSLDYFVLVISNADLDMSGGSGEIAPAADLTNDPDHAFGIRVFQQGSDPNARVNLQHYVTNIPLTDTSLATKSWAKAFVIGTPTVVTEVGEDVTLHAPRVRIKALPYDLRTIRLGGERG